jgi:hypothetical protein
MSVSVWRHDIAALAGPSLCIIGGADKVLASTSRITSAGDFVTAASTIFRSAARGYRSQCRTPGRAGAVSTQGATRVGRPTLRVISSGDSDGSPVHGSCVIGRSSRIARCRLWPRGPPGCNPATCATRSENAGRPCRRCLPGRRGPAWRCRRCCSTSCCRSG